MNKYRYEIDSLRGISILLVVLFHCKIELFKWGFIGVDIFFVISGFLITKIIQNNIFKKKFFLSFIENRIRRIVPLLLFCLLINLIVYYYLFDPAYILTLSKIVLSILLIVQNYYFMFLNGYFDITSDKNILLHTWSLAVELQFYLIFYFLFIFLFFFLKKKNKILFAIILVFSLSFLASNYASISKEFIFYSTVTRFWEFLSGSIVALINYKKINKIFKNKYFLEFTLIIILILLIYFFFYKNIVFESYVILLPIIATSIILIFIKKKTFIFNLLNFKPLRFLGLISFSLYIWHYNIFAIGRNLKVEELSLTDYLTLTIISVVISITSYFLIEKPFRNKKLINTKYLVIILTVKFVIILFIIFKNYDQQGHVFRNKLLTNTDLPKNYFLNSQISYFENKGQIQSCLKSVSGICTIISSDNPSNKILLIGDSTMLDYIRPFEDFSKKNNINSSILYKPGKIFKKETTINNSQKQTIDFILNSNFDIYVFVILFPDNEFLVELFKKISVKEKKIVFFTPRPILNYNPIKVMILGKINNNILKANNFYYNNNNIYWSNLFSKKNLHNGFLIFDQFKAILNLSCGSAVCFNGHINKEIPIYRDEAHLTSVGSNMIFNNFLERNIKFLIK